ncbi:hypothetical protein [Dokdonella sp.]|uniref:hypothetical protein n=1 Tax=Dokdonella sp. TaxID=2291710 RepID=UPI003C41A2EA
MSSLNLKSALRTLLVSAMLMCCTTAAWAQADKKAKPAMQTQGAIATVWMFWPKAGQGPQFEAAIKKHAAWRKSAGEKFVWSIYQPIVGSDLGYYVVRSGRHEWEELDANEAWGMQAKADDAFNTTVNPFVDRAEHYFSELDHKHSNWIESPDYKYYSVSNYSAKPGMYGDRREALDKIQKAVIDEKWAYSYSIAHTMGGSGGFSIVTPMKSYAEMADPDPSLMKILAKSLGSESEATSTMKQFSSTINGSETTIYVRRADLSTPE